jgi:hypothetical protein
MLWASTSQRSGNLSYEMAEFGVLDTRTSLLLDAVHVVAKRDTQRVDIFPAGKPWGGIEFGPTGTIAAPLDSVPASYSH